LVRYPPLPPSPFGDQAAGAIDTGGVELDELHVLKRQPLTRDHAVAVAGAGMSGRGTEIGATVAAGRQNGGLGVEQVQCAVVQLPRQNTLTLPVFGHDQVGGKILDVEFGLLLERLAVKRVQDGVAGSVGGGTGALHGWAFAEFGGVPAKGPLIDLAVFGATERNAVVFKFVDGLGGFASKVFHRVRIAQPVRALDGVIHVPLPVVGAHIGQRRGDAALRGHGVGPGRKHLGDTGGLEPLLGQTQRRTQARAARTDHDGVESMCFES